MLPLLFIYSGLPPGYENIKQGDTHQHVEVLYDVQEDFILTVSDAFGSPRHIASNSRRKPLLCFKTIRALRYIPIPRLVTKAGEDN